MSPRAVASGLAVTAVLLGVPDGTQAAWTDGATATAPGALSATSVPPPVLACTRVGLTAEISWPMATLPGPGAPAVDYTARVVEAATPLTVAGTTAPGLVIEVPDLVGALVGQTRTIEVTARVDFGATTWTTSSTAQVRLALISLSPGVSCA